MLLTINIKRAALVSRVILLLITFMLITFAYAQKNLGIVKGFLSDSTSQEPINDATISILQKDDSSFRSFILSTTKGFFQITNLKEGNYILIASYQGMETLKREFSISAQVNIVDFDTLKIGKEYKTLREVIVKDQVPIKVNGDTLAYKAGAFKTKPNATVEDLLKKLPGVQVDRNGSIKAQGEQIQKVYVDGKEFFSNDPKLATNNLTADMIDQVQVYNDMSEQSKFNGIDDGSRSKAINLKLKKDKKSGVFGKAYTGYGTDNRYNIGVTTNYFKGATQLSFIAGTNNINNTGYTVSNMMNTRINSNNAGNGDTKNSSIGLNYRDTWSKYVDISGSYFFSRDDATNLRKSFKQTFLSDSTLLTDRQSIYNTLNGNHRFNLKVVYTIDSFNSIIYTPTVSVQNSEVFTNDTLTNHITKNGTDYNSGNTRTINASKGNTYNLMNNLIWRRRFNKPGRTFSINLSSISNKGERTGYTVIHSRFYNSEESLYGQRDADYKINSDDKTNNYGLVLSYTEPIAANTVLELNYSHNNNKSKSDLKTYNYNSTTKEYDELLDTLSNMFQNENAYSRIGTNVRGINKRYTYQLGLAVQQTLQESNDLNKKTNLAQRYINLLPTASFNYRFTKNKNLQVNYRGQSNQPNLLQLQNVTNVTNYPYIRKGNPDLKQEFVNNFMITYNSFNSSKFQNLFAYVTYTRTGNKIVNSIKEVAGEQIYMPVNLNGVYNISGTFNYGLPIKRMEGGNINVTTNISYNHNANVINGLKNYVKDLSIAEEFSLSYNYQDKLDLGLNADVTYNLLNYTIQKDQNSSYFTHDYTLEATYSFAKTFIFSTTADYTIYTGRSSEFNQNYIIWNASISKQLFKNNRGELKLSINDILNKNINVSRNAVDNYIEDVSYKTLKRFVMLTFIYNISQVGIKNFKVNN